MSSVEATSIETADGKQAKANADRRIHGGTKKTKSPKPKKQAKTANGKKTRQSAKNEIKAEKKTKAADGREGSKKAIVLELLRRKEGATIAEIAKATNWQNHSVRGFISGTITKKMGLTVESEKSEAGERSYRITM